MKRGAAGGRDGSQSDGGPPKKPRPPSTGPNTEPSTTYDLSRFPDKLRWLLDNQVAPEALRWTSEGGAIAINKKKFVDQLIETHFQGNKWPSVTRKFNRWGFKRVEEDQEPRGVMVYSHPLFRRDNPTLLEFMVREEDRKKSASGAGSITPPGRAATQTPLHGSFQHQAQAQVSSAAAHALAMRRSSASSATASFPTIETSAAASVNVRHGPETMQHLQIDADFTSRQSLQSALLRAGSPSSGLGTQPPSHFSNLADQLQASQLAARDNLRAASLTDFSFSNQLAASVLGQQRSQSAAQSTRRARALADSLTLDPRTQLLDQASVLQQQLGQGLTPDSALGRLLAARRPTPEQLPLASSREGAIMSQLLAATRPQSGQITNRPPGQDGAMNQLLSGSISAEQLAQRPLGTESAVSQLLAASRSETEQLRSRLQLERSLNTSLVGRAGLSSTSLPPQDRLPGFSRSSLASDNISTDQLMLLHQQEQLEQERLLQLRQQLVQNRGAGDPLSQMTLSSQLSQQGALGPASTSSLTPAERLYLLGQQQQSQQQRRSQLEEEKEQRRKDRTP